MTHVISPKVSTRQRDIIIGTILGGSSVVKPSKGKNCYLSMRCKDLGWLRFKATELANLASSSPITTEKTNRWHSMCYPCFNEFREMFYANGKRRLDIDNLSLLRDVTLAIWYGDCGHFKREHVVLNTHIWGKKGTDTIKEYFSYLGYNPIIFRERGSLRVRLDKDSSKQFIKLIMPHIPEGFRLT